MKNKIVCLAVILFSMLIAAHSTLAGVNVFAEGAYTDDDLAIYIYANTNVEGLTVLRSAGVKLTYNASQLAAVSADKNEAVWSLGGEEYMNPETSTPGEVVIILGKLDPDDTSAGVSGERVLLGVVKFNRISGQFDPENPELNLTYGKRGTEIPGSNPTEYSFKNFVDTDANVLDDTAVSFTPVTEIYERGDANADGSINISDVTEIRKMVFNQIPKTCYADCNNDGDVNISDVTSIRDKVFQ
ncbi:hypothetical protein BuS5_01388 [Desulfosarcina sp. BuS5]|uniref:dockerin type I repeat-containing protein n=1 Tax=Desulfosarcina sp. BuS5 TaxID=933262 RepID=UPI000480CA50|nr:dockerin type I repeat-containing protein [Desulfosarcina sp. BuS5]WDN88420.1 hypothetical protein BuS5_01388 [Desulfosarcina sp. BuS5]